jgi:hypothetical protein
VYKTQQERSKEQSSEEREPFSIKKKKQQDLVENELYSLMDLMLLSLEGELHEGMFKMLLPSKSKSKSKKKKGTIFLISFN